MDSSLMEIAKMVFMKGPADLRSRKKKYDKEFYGKTTWGLSRLPLHCSHHKRVDIVPVVLVLDCSLSDGNCGSS